MTIFVALVLAMLTFAFIAYPFFKQRSRSVDSVEDEELRELHPERDTTYSMLRDIDDLKKGTEVEEEIEKQVLELRRGKGLFCPECGAGCQQGDRLCSHCGTSLSSRGSS